MKEQDQLIEQLLKRIRTRRRLYWGAIVLVVIGMLVVFPLATPRNPLVPIIYVIVGGAIVGYLDLLMRQIECPRCHEPFFRNTEKAFKIPMVGWKYWKSCCASCGITLRENR